MKVLNVETMRSIERKTINDIGIPSIVLMENASQKIIKNIDFNKFKKILVVCGNGNNGGDGLAVAKNLKLLGIEVDLFVIKNDRELKGDCKINYNILKNLNSKIKFLKDIEDLKELSNSVQRSDLIIDAIFGTGLNKELNSFTKKVISLINEKSKYTIAIDIPSGMDVNTGNIMGNCIRANKTITFETYKEAFLAYNVFNYTGEIVIEKIGIPTEMISRYKNSIEITERADIQSKIQKRNIYGYKGDYGRVLIVAGNEGYTGAAYIATQAAIKSGAGLVTLSTKKNIQNILSIKLSEAMTSSYEEIIEFEHWVCKSDVVAIGPGMGNNRNTLECLKRVIHKSKSSIVIDADGINVLADNKELLKLNSKIIITPHLGEMAKLIEKDIDYIKQNRIKVAREFAKEYGVIVILKGFNTIITDGEKVYVNPTGNSSMSSGGMGDCLTGVIASFVAQGYLNFESAIIGTYIHGFIGEFLSKTMASVTATDIINLLPKFIKEFQIN